MNTDNTRLVRLFQNMIRRMVESKSGQNTRTDEEYGRPFG